MQVAGPTCRPGAVGPASWSEVVAASGPSGGGRQLAGCSSSSAPAPGSRGPRPRVGATNQAGYQVSRRLIVNGKAPSEPEPAECGAGGSAETSGFDKPPGVGAAGSSLHRRVAAVWGGRCSSKPVLSSRLGRAGVSWSGAGLQARAAAGLCPFCVTSGGLPGDRLPGHMTSAPGPNQRFAMVVARPSRSLGAMTALQASLEN